MRPLYNRLQHRGINGNGRTDRASLQRATRIIATRQVRPGRSTTDALWLDTSVRPYRIQSRLVSSRSASLQRATRIIATRQVRPGRSTTDALWLDTSVRPYRIQSRLVSSHSASLQRATRIIATRRIAIRPAHADLFDTTCG